MDADILTTITGVAGATKTTIEAVRAALAKTKANQETLALVADLQTRILTLQEIAFRLHEEKVQAFKEKTEALEENARLRAEVRRKEEGAADREKYERRRIGRSVVVVDKQDPQTYLCATCFEASEKAYLSPLPRHMRAGTHTCPKCKARISTRL